MALKDRLTAEEFGQLLRDCVQKATEDDSPVLVSLSAKINVAVVINETGKTFLDFKDPQRNAELTFTAEPSPIIKARHEARAVEIKQLAMMHLAEKLGLNNGS